MNRRIAKLVLLLTLVVSLAPAVTGPATASVDRPGSAASAASVDSTRAKPTVYFDYNYQQTVKPRRIFFSANSGTYVRKLVWKQWGTAKATATGTYVSTCASCSPPRYRAARLIFSGRTYCKTRDVFYYKRGVLIRKPSEGQTRRAQIGGGTCPPADSMG